MVFCTSCGFEVIDESSKFCPKCGKTVFQKPNIDSQLYSVSNTTINPSKRTILQIIGLVLIAIYVIDVVGTTTVTWNEDSGKGYVIFKYPDGEMVKLESYFDVLYMTAIFVSTTSIVAIFGMVLLIISIKIKKSSNKIT